MDSWRMLRSERSTYASGSVLIARGRGRGGRRHPKFSWECTENQVTRAKCSRSRAIFTEEQVVLRILSVSEVPFSGPLGVFLTSMLGKGYPLLPKS